MTRYDGIEMEFIYPHPFMLANWLNLEQICHALEVDHADASEASVIYVGATPLTPSEAF